MVQRCPPTAPLTVAALLVVSSISGSAAAATIDWKGHTWQVTSGGMAGACEGAPENVSVDSDGYLHLNIANRAGKWTAAEIFSTDRLGFGTYQWHVDGNIDTYDKNVVLGLFPYGPAAGIGRDGTNEIDIEYSRWGNANGPNGDYTDYPASGTTIGELSYTFTLGGAKLSTSRFVWTPTGITSSLLSGLAIVGDDEGLLKTWSYAPPNPSQNIPQQALPLGMNLWCFDAPPSDSKPVEIVVRDFSFIAPSAGGGGSNGGGTGGSAAGGAAGASTQAGSGGTTAGTASSSGGSDTTGAGGSSSATGGSNGSMAGAAEPSAGSTGAGATTTNGGVSAGGNAGHGGTGAVATAPAAGAGAPINSAKDNAGCGCSVPGTGRRAPLELGLLWLMLAVARRLASPPRLRLR